MHIDRIELGRYIRRVRKSKGLRQMDLEDENISQVMISYVETGKTDVSEDKISYLLKKLNIKENDVAEFYINEEEIKQREVDEELELRLVSIENIIDLVDPDSGLSELKDIFIPNGSHLHVTVNYLKGKSYLKKRNAKKTRKYFFETIRSIDDKYPEMLTSNLKAASYFDLSKLEYFNNDLHKALEYCKKGEQSFIIDGKRPYLKPGLLISKVIYLQKLNRLEDAQSILDEISSLKASSNIYYAIESKEIILNIYELQATIWAKGNMTNHAIDHAKKGIEFARIDKAYDRSCELWTTLGSIYNEKNKLNLAEICFLTALKLRNKIRKEYLLSYANTQLGNLYAKRNQFSEAEEKFQKAIKISQKINDAYQETEALMGLGDCYVSQMKNNQAINCFKQALEIATQHSFIKQKNQSLLKLGHFLKAIGSPDFREYALHFFESHVETLIKHDEGGEEEMTYNLGPVKRHSAGDPPDL